METDNKPKPRARKKRTGAIGGVKTSYRPYMCRAVTDYLLLHGGASQREIAEHLGVTESVFSKWLLKFEALEKAVKEGKDGADSEVINSAYKSATGFDYYEETAYRVTRYEYNENGKVCGREDTIETEMLKKHQPPNITAIQFWLANRHPGEWTRTDRLKLEAEKPDKIDTRDYDDSPFLAMAERYNVESKPLEIPGIPLATESMKHGKNGGKQGKS